MRRPLCFTVLSFLLATGAALAQTVSSTTGTINGKVEDTSGGVLPGVTVTIASPAMMGTRDTVTSDTGEFRFVSITPGDYDVTFELPGFATVKRTGVRVGAAFTATLNIQMNVAGLEEAVTVTGASPVVDTQSTKISTSFDSKTLAALPTGSGDQWSVLAATPAVKMSRIDVGGSTSGTQTQFTTYGTTGQQRPYIEGINGTEGTGSNGNYVDMASFDEVAVSASGNNAEMGPPGVHMVFVSKSGGNTYHGQLAANYQNRKWQSYNIDAALVAQGVQGGGGLEPRDTNRMHSFKDNNANVGGFVVKDKLWWFGAYRDLESQVRYTNFPVKPFVTRLKTSTVKGTYQLTQNNKLIGYYEYNTKRQPTRLDAFQVSNANVLHTSADSTFDQQLGVTLWKAEFNSVLSDSLFFEIRVGQWGYDWYDYKYTDAPRYEDTSSNLVSGASRLRNSEPRRPQTLGSLSYFKEGWGGNHNMKVGWEIFCETSAVGQSDGSYNNVVHILRNGTPLEVYLLGNPYLGTAGMWTTGLYYTDTWRVNNKLNLNLGVRYDRYQNFLQEQSHEADRFFPERVVFPAVANVRTWNTVAPRIGVSYSLTEDNRTVLKGNWGIYWDNPGTGAGNPNGTWQKRHAWSDTNGNRVWDPGEEGRLISSQGGVETLSNDPNQKDKYTADMGVFLERELVANLAIRGGFVRREEHQLIATVNTNQPYEAFSIPVSIFDPGPDGVRGNADDGAPITAFNLDAAHLGLPTKNLVTNLPGSSYYNNWEIGLTKRMSNRWSLQAAATYTDSYAYIVAGTGLYNPNSYINADANGRDHTSDYNFKLNGQFEAPMGFKFSPVYRFQAGSNFGRTFVTRELNYANPSIRAEAPSTRRQPHINIVDLRLDRAFTIGKGRLAPFVDLYNLFNANPTQSITTTSGTSWLRPVLVVPPRVIRIGAKFDW